MTARQKHALTFLKTNGRITNTGYEKLTAVAKRTAHRDLLELIQNGGRADLRAPSRSSSGCVPRRVW
jgi:hypothetical protein